MGANAEDIERLGVSIAVLVSSPVTFTPPLACRYPYLTPTLTLTLPLTS